MSVSFELPEAGAFLFGFAKSLLQLEIPLAQEGWTNKHVSVYGTEVEAGGTSVVHVPQWAAARWPSELHGPGIEILIGGLNLGGVPFNMTCKVQAPTKVTLECTLVEAGV